MSNAIKLKQMSSVLVRSWMARTNVLFLSEPGIGKTQTVEAFIEKMRQRMPEFRGWFMDMGTMSPLDIVATAPDTTTGKLRLYPNAGVPNAYDDPDQVGVIFVDEILNGDPATNKVAQKYFNGEDVGGALRKPRGVIVVGASNRISDKAGVQQQSRAFLSRFEQVEVYNDAEANIEFMKSRGWHSTVVSYLEKNPAAISNYAEVFNTADARNKSENATLSEESKRGIWANMRTWERVSKKEFAADELGAALTMSEVAGNVGQGVAGGYSVWKNMLSKLASFEQIMASPDKVAVPDKANEQYALAMMVAMRAPDTADGIRAARVFGERLDITLQTVMIRTLALRPGANFASSGDYAQWITKDELTAALTAR